MTRAEKFYRKNLTHFWFYAQSNSLFFFFGCFLGPTPTLHEYYGGSLHLKNANST